MLDCFGTEQTDVERIEKAVRKLFPLKPAGLIEHLKLLTPVYEKTAAYGHFGRPEFAWEKTELADALRAELGLAKKAKGANGNGNGHHTSSSTPASKKTAKAASGLEA